MCVQQWPSAISLLHIFTGRALYSKQRQQQQQQQDELDERDCRHGWNENLIACTNLYFMRFVCRVCECVSIVSHSIYVYFRPVLALVGHFNYSWRCDKFSAAHVVPKTMNPNGISPRALAKMPSLICYSIMLIRSLLSIHVYASVSTQTRIIFRHDPYYSNWIFHLCAVALPIIEFALFLSLTLSP